MCPDTFTTTLNGVTLDQSGFTIAGNEAFAISLGNCTQATRSDRYIAQRRKQVFHLDQVGPVVRLLDGGSGNPHQISGYLLIVVVVRSR